MQQSQELLKLGKLLIFANQKETCEEVARFYKESLRINALTLYGDKNQYDRTIAMNSFKG
jgi:superfamily II DNA/RNA helicase